MNIFMFILHWNTKVIAALNIIWMGQLSESAAIQWRNYELFQRHAILDTFWLRKQNMCKLFFPTEEAMFQFKLGYSHIQLIRIILKVHYFSNSWLIIELFINYTQTDVFKPLIMLIFYLQLLLMKTWHLEYYIRPI